MRLRARLPLASGRVLPPEAGVSPNGVFQWTPAREQGSTTNLITLWAVDDGTPALSNSVSFNVVVGAFIQVTIGSGTVLAGNVTSVPVSLYSTVGLTNVSFSLATLAGCFTNWAANSGNAGLVTVAAQASDPSHPQFSFAPQNGHTLLGAVPLGAISVEALPDATSAFAPLTINQIAATAPSNTPAGPVFGQSGRVVLIGGQALLEASLTNGSNPTLILYGNPGSNYTVMSATNLLAPVTWTALTNFTLTAAVQTLDPGPMTSQMGFFRVCQQ